MYMEEKYMVNDILECVKANLKKYQEYITESENLGLRQTLQQIRDNDESFQYELFKVAQAKGYYLSSKEVKEQEIEEIKKEVNN